MNASADDRLPGVVRGLGLVVWEADARTGEFGYVSEQVEVLLGYPVRRLVDEPGFWGSLIHPDDRDDVARLSRLYTAESDDYELTYRVVAAGGRVVSLRHLAHVVRDDTGTAVRLQGVWIGASRRTANDRFLAGLERELQPVEDAERIMELVARRLGEYIGADRCAYARAEADDDHFVMSGDYATGLPHLPGRFAMREFGAGCLRAMRAGEPWIVEDSRTDARLEPADHAAYEYTGIRAVICLPLHKAGRFVAAMAVHQAVPRHWTPEEIELVGVVVNRCWESLQRTHAGWALRDSEHRYRLLVERATDGIWIFDHDLRFVDVNPAACALIGLDRTRLIGRNVGDIAAPRHLERLTELVSDPNAEQVLNEVWDVRRADGTKIALELSIQTTPTGLQAIGRDVTERRRAEAERELLLQREHDIAEALQRSLLPRELPALERLAASARYLPASTHAQTGGDWYEILPLTDTLVALSVGDVVGKGPTAAAIMGQLRSALAGYLLDGHAPAAALDRLDAFVRRTAGATGSTCACLTLDLESGRLRSATAGHPPPLIVHSGHARYLTDSGPVLGTPDRSPYAEGGATLTPGDSVVLYTDGLVERRDTLIDDGLDHLRQVVQDAHRLGPEPLTSTITDTLLADGHDDDAALVVVRHLPEPLHRVVPAVPTRISELRREVAAWAETAALPADQLDDLQLALGEAAANTVEHAYPDEPGDLDYRIARTATGSVHVTVTDHGRWRPEPPDNTHRGRGLHIIRALADDVRLDPSDTGTTIDFHLPSPTTIPTTPPAPAADTAPELTVDSTADALVLRLTGDLDLATADTLRRPLLSRIGTDRPVTIDLTRLRYLSSSGIALLLDAAALSGRTLTLLVQEDTPPARILTISGLTTTFTIHTRSLDQIGAP